MDLAPNVKKGLGLLGDASKVSDKALSAVLSETVAAISSASRDSAALLSLQANLIVLPHFSRSMGEIRQIGFLQDSSLPFCFRE